METQSPARSSRQREPPAVAGSTWSAEEARCFRTPRFNLWNAEQKQAIDPAFGLDWRWVRSAIQETFTDEDGRKAMNESTNIFPVLIKTLLKAGIITDRTRSICAAWLDMEELRREDDEVAGIEVADAALADLTEINAGRRVVSRALRS